MFWRPSNIFNLFSKSHTEHHNQPVCEDQETTPSSRIGTMAMPGANLQKKKKSTRIHPSDQAPDDYGRSYARPYRPRAGGWDTGVAEDRSESRSSYQGGLSFAKGHIPSTATLPKFQKNSNAVSKTGAAVLFGNALDDINQNQNAKPSNARTRNSHLRQGSSASHDRQPTVKICGRAKGKQKANNGPIDLTLDDDPIESFSDQGDCGPHTNIRISSRPLQSSSKDKTDDPMLLRSKYNPQSRRKSQTNTDHNVERQYLPPQNKTITKSFACKRVHLWAEEGLATLPFPDACDSSRLYVDGHAIIFEGQLLSEFRMKFTADDIEKIFTQTPPKRERFALQLRADFTWTQGTSPCGFIEQPRGWSLPASDPKKSCTPPPPGVIFFELDSGDTRASQDALASLFNTLTVISSPRPCMLVPSLDTTWNSWLPPANQWQRPKESPLGPLSNRQSSKDDHMTRIPNSDEIEIQLQDRPKSPLPNHHKPNISSKDRHTGTSTRFTRDQPDGPDLELNETCTLNVSTRDQLMNPQPPSKGRNTIVSLPPKPTTQSSFKDFSSTEAYHTPKRTLRSSTREKANTTTTASFKPKPDDHINESSKVTGKRTHNSVTGTAPDSQQKADSDIILVWPYESKNSVAITHADMRRLEEGEFLNDTLIEFGLQWELEKIRQRDSKISESIYLFNSFFFQKLSRKSKKKLDVTEESKIAYEGVRKWTKGYDLFTKEFVVIPINEHMHWYFMIVANPGKILDVTPLPTNDPTNRTTRSRSSVASMLEGAQSTFALPADEEDQLQDSPHFPKDEAGSTIDDQPAMDVDDPTVALGQMKLENKEDQNMLDGSHNDSSPPCVLTLDSLATGSHRSQAKTILRYFVNEANTKRSANLTYPIVDHIAITKVSVPEQPNFCDCGLYLIHAFKTFFEDTSGMMNWIHANSSRKKRSEDFDWPAEVRKKWNAEAAETARQQMKQTVYDCVPGYQKHLEEVKLKKSKERHSKDLLASTATQPKVEIEGMPPNGLVSARKSQYESLSSNQPANSQQHPASAMEIDTDIINIDPPHLPRDTTPHVKATTRVVPEQSPAPLCESTSNNLTAINNDELSPRKKRRRVVDHVDDHPEDSRVQTIQMKGHSKKTPMKFYSGGTSRTPRQSEDISMSEATGSPAEEVQRPHEAARTPASECGSTHTPSSGSVHLSADIDGDPLDNLHSYRSSPQNEIELPPAIQDKIENGQLITTPMPNQAVTPDMSPTDQGGINSSAPVGFSESSQSRNSTRRTSYQHQNSIESSLEAPFVSDAERTRNNKQRRDPQMPYQAARAIDQQQLQNSIYIKKPTGEPNDPIPLD